MGRPKAPLAAATRRARGRRGNGLLAGEIVSEANPEDSVFQALAVYDGSRCIGYLMPRGKTGVEAFDANTRSLGIFPTMKAAADAVSQAAGGTASSAPDQQSEST